MEFLALTVTFFPVLWASMALTGLLAKLLKTGKPYWSQYE